MNRPDTYTKVVLTLIAVCLVWLCIKDAEGVRWTAPAFAEAPEPVTRVILVGVDTQDLVPVSLEQISRRESPGGMAVAGWEPIPVHGR